MDQGSNENHYRAYNFAPTVTKCCVMWEGLSLPHDTKFGNCRCEIVDSRAFPSWSLIHGLRWSGLIKAEPEQPCRMYPRSGSRLMIGLVRPVRQPCGIISGSLHQFTGTGTAASISHDNLMRYPFSLDFLETYANSFHMKLYKPLIL